MSIVRAVVMDKAFGEDGIARILVVDDNPSMREAVALIIEEEHDLCVCAEANCIAEALAECETLQPDLAMVDLSLKGEDGLALIKHLADHTPHIATVVFSLHDEPFYINGARSAGARGYVIKSEGADSMLACLRTVLGGGHCFTSPGEP